MPSPWQTHHVDMAYLLYLWMRPRHHLASSGAGQKEDSSIQLSLGTRGLWVSGPPSGMAEATEAHASYVKWQAICIEPAHTLPYTLKQL